MFTYLRRVTPLTSILCLAFLLLASLLVATWSMRPSSHTLGAHANGTCSERKTIATNTSTVGGDTIEADVQGLYNIDGSFCGLYGGQTTVTITSGLSGNFYNFLYKGDMRETCMSHLNLADQNNDPGIGPLQVTGNGTYTIQTTSTYSGPVVQAIAFQAPVGQNLGTRTECTTLDPTAE